MAATGLVTSLVRAQSAFVCGVPRPSGHSPPGRGKPFGENKWINAAPDAIADVAVDVGVPGAETVQTLAELGDEEIQAVAQQIYQLRTP